MKEKDISRRKFIKNSIGTVSLIGLSTCTSLSWGKSPGAKYKSPNEKLNIACIGCGGQGNADINGISSENIVALCDVMPGRAKAIYEKYPDVPKFQDYRVMLEKLDGQIDAVTVSTPDHTHFPAAMMAMEMGKHVRVQKPLTRTIWEARQLTEAARKYNVVTQMGNQGHAKEGARLVCEWIGAGAIGEVREVHIWTDRPFWPQGIDRPPKFNPRKAIAAQGGLKRVYANEPKKKVLDWNLWLGTAPYRPYNEAYVPWNWRGWWDFGTGSLGDMGCHLMDASFWALDLKYPESFEAVSSPVNDETAPLWSTVTYNFPARGNMPPVKVIWYDGKENKPPRPKELEEGRNLESNGQLIMGETGTIMAGAYGDSPRIIPEEKMKEFLPNRPPKTIPRIQDADSYWEWINACKGGEKPGSNFDYAGPLTEMVLAGNLAIRTGKKILWDGPNMKALNAPEAEQFIKPWEFREF